MRAERSAETRVQEIGSFSRALKAIARELGCPVVALSQLNHNVEHRPDKRPTMADLRESGDIENDADLACFLYREDYYDPRQRARRRSRPLDPQAPQRPTRSTTRTSGPNRPRTCASSSTSRTRALQRRPTHHLNAPPSSVARALAITASVRRPPRGLASTCRTGRSPSPVPASRARPGGRARLAAPGVRARPIVRARQPPIPRLPGAHRGQHALPRPARLDRAGMAALAVRVGVAFAVARAGRRAAGAARALIARLDRAGLLAGGVVEIAPHGRRRAPQPLCDLRDREPLALAQVPGDRHRPAALLDALLQAGHPRTVADLHDTCRTPWTDTVLPPRDGVERSSCASASAAAFTRERHSRRDASAEEFIAFLVSVKVEPDVNIRCQQVHRGAHNNVRLHAGTSVLRLK